MADDSATRDSANMQYPSTYNTWAAFEDPVKNISNDTEHSPPKRNSNANHLGFVTGTGVKIHISDAAMSNARSIVSEVEETFSSNDENTSNLLNFNYKPRLSSVKKTATSFHNTLPSFKVQSAEHAQTAFSTENVYFSNCDTMKLVNDQFHLEGANLSSIAFSTASGYKVNVPKEAILKANAIFSHPAFSDSAQASRAMLTHDSPEVENPLLSTSLTKYDLDSTTHLPSEKLQNQNSFCDLLISSNKLEQIFQPPAIRHVESFDQRLQDPAHNAENATYDTSIEREKHPLPLCFSTAKGNIVNVSDQAISKASTVFEEECQNLILSESVSHSAIQRISTKISQPGLPNTPPLCELRKRKSIQLHQQSALKSNSISKFKRARFTNDLHSKKLFLDDSEEAMRFEQKNISPSDTHMLSNSICASKFISTINSPVNLNNGTNLGKDDVIVKESDMGDINEIVASSVALLADEKESDKILLCCSQNGPQITNDDLPFPSSPIVGRRSTVRTRLKRKRADTAQTGDVDNGIDITKSTSANTAMVLNSCSNSGNISLTNVAPSQLAVNFIDKSAIILQERMAAALEQDKIIAYKKRNRPQPIASRLYLYKEANDSTRISWKNLAKNSAPLLCSCQELIERNISPEILKITATTALSYRFRCADFFGSDIIRDNTYGLRMGENSNLIPDQNGYAGLPEISQSFLASTGVDPTLVCHKWIKNHYRWIIWKLASMDRIKFGAVHLPKALTPLQLMEQLRYRYDREIDRCQRSALKQILEKDNAASKRMILLVSSILKPEPQIVGTSPNSLPTLWKVEVTDGWYSVPLSIDTAMVNYIASGKVEEGTKLIIFGAELLNCDRGCSPLEIPSNVSLRIHTNSTRRVRWYSRLGYTTPIGPIPVELRTVSPHGGLIGKLTVTVVRVYPMLYCEKTNTGESVIRNARCEEKANTAYEENLKLQVEAFYAQAETCFNANKNNYSSDTNSIDSWAAEWNDDYENLSGKEFHSKEQHDNLLHECHMKEEQFRERLRSQLQATLPPARQVTSLLKIRVTDKDANAILAVWSPCEDVIDVLKEGSRITICNAFASGKRGGKLQLTAGRNAVFKKQISLGTNPFCRVFTHLSDISNPNFHAAYSEIDTVGIVVSILSNPYGMTNFEAVNLAYPSLDLSSFSYLSILFWQGTSSYGYADLLTVGSFVACINLERRRATSWNIPLAYCTERTVFTHNPRYMHLQEAFQILKNIIPEPHVYITKCAEEIVLEVRKKSTSSTPENIHGKKDTPCKLVCGPISSKTPELCSNPFIQQRYEKLKCYGTPPDLPPLVFRSISKRISQNFHSPIRAPATASDGDSIKYRK